MVLFILQLMLLVNTENFNNFKTASTFITCDVNAVAGDVVSKRSENSNKLHIGSGGCSLY